MSALFDSVKRLYDSGSITKDGLKKAVEKQPKPWITKDEYKIICGEDYTVPTT